MNSCTPSPRSLTPSPHVSHNWALCMMGLMSLFQRFYHSLKSSAELVTCAHFRLYTVISTLQKCSFHHCPSSFRLLLLTFGRSSTGGFNKTGHFRNRSMCLWMVLLGLCLWLLLTLCSPWPLQTLKKAKGRRSVGVCSGSPFRALQIGKPLPPPLLSFICGGLRHSGSGDGGASDPLPAKNNSKHANVPLNTHTVVKSCYQRWRTKTAFALQMSSKSPCFPFSISIPAQHPKLTVTWQHPLSIGLARAGRC